MSSSDDLAANVAAWTESNAQYTDRAAAKAWAQAEITWGMFAVPESEVRALGDVAGRDVVELGCGTAYLSAWLARAGARPVGVDPTPAQLETARRVMRETGVEFPLLEAPGEAVPLPDASFDLALSEHGAATWADPRRWIPEAFRLLRPGGRLVFLGLGRTVWEGDEGVEHQLTHGDWIDVLLSSGFAVERLVELQAPASARTHEYYAYVPADWARQWPGEEIWVARKGS